MFLAWRTGCERWTGSLIFTTNHRDAAMQFERREDDDGCLPPRSVSVVDEEDDSESVCVFVFDNKDA